MIYMMGILPRIIKKAKRRFSYISESTYERNSYELSQNFKNHERDRSGCSFDRCTEKRGREEKGKEIAISGEQSLMYISGS